MNLSARRRGLMGIQEEATVHGTWEDLFKCIDKGTYASEYSVGETLPLDLGAQGVVDAQIAAFDADACADNSGNAPVTFITKYLLATAKRFNPSLSGTTEGTGTIGGWPKSEIRTYLNGTIKNLIDASIRSRIVSVKKYSRIYNTSDTVENNVSSDDEIWLPSSREVFNRYESSGPVYSSLFGTVAYNQSSDKRVKTPPNSSTATGWALRSANTDAKIVQAATTGATGYYSAGSTSKYAIGFCVK